MHTLSFFESHPDAAHRMSSRNHLRSAFSYISSISDAVPFFDPASPHLEGVRHGSIRGREFFGYHQHTFQFFEARQVLVQFFDDAFIQRLHLGVRDQCLLAKQTSTWFARAQSSRTGKCGEISTAGNLRRSPSTTAVPISGFSFSEFSIGCGAMNFPPEVLIRSFLRSVMERYPSLSRCPMSPVLNQPSTNAFARLLGTIPITLEDRGPAHQHLAVVGDAHFDVRQRLADCAQFVRRGRIHRDHRRSLGQPVAFVDGNANIGIPLGQFAAQRRASGNELLRLAAHPGAHLRKDQAVRDFPGERLRPGSGQNLGAVSAPHRKRPAIDGVASESPQS